MDAISQATQRKAVVFGVGKMACGLLGDLLYKSGYQTQFISRRPEVIESINRHQGYRLTVTGETEREFSIGNCLALPSNDKELVAEAVAGADVVFTAVGIDNISSIAPVIAEGLWRRTARGTQPVNVIACENLPGTGAYLRHQIVGAASLEKAVAVDRNSGFSAALTHRIMTGGELSDGALHFRADMGGDLIIDSRGLIAPIADIGQAAVSSEFDALFLKKLSTINCAQAVAAYLGHRHGCSYVHEAARHPKVAPIVEAALGEAVAALKAEYPHHGEAIEHDAEEALRRINNALLVDTIERVARGPQRKLAARERLVAPARLAARRALPCDNLALAIAAALSYDESRDPQAQEMQRLIAGDGVDAVLTNVCGMLPHEGLSHTIKRHWARLAGGQKNAGLPARHLDDILLRVHSELGQQYDPNIVSDILGRLGREFQSARIMNYLPILMRKRAHEQLLDVNR